MAITIYKYAYHVAWDTVGIAVPRSGGGGGAGTFTDLSAYYTMEQLQTSGSSQVHFDNLIEAYHNNLLGLQGGGGSESTPSSEEYYHLAADEYARLLSLTFGGSLIEDSVGNVELDGDSDTPGASKLYGTNASGTKGWYSLPDTGGGGITGAGADNQVAVFNGTGSIEGTANLTYDGSTFYFNGSLSVGTDFVLNSDKKLKQNIAPVPTDPVDVEYKQFEFKEVPGQVRYGVIAQDLLTHHPELVRVGKDDVLSVAYIDLLVREIAYLKAKVAELEAKIK